MDEKRDKKKSFALLKHKNKEKRKEQFKKFIGNKSEGNDNRQKQ